MKVYNKPALIKLKGKDKLQAKVTFEYAQFCNIVAQMTKDIYA